MDANVSETQKMSPTINRTGYTEVNIAQAQYGCWPVDVATKKYLSETLLHTVKSVLSPRGKSLPNIELFISYRAYKFNLSHSSL